MNQSISNGYVRITKGLVDKGQLVKPSEIYQIIKDSEKDYYKSLYRYNESHYEKFKKSGSIRGINDVVTNVLIFDFDSKSNLDKTKEDAKVCISRLVKSGIKESDIQLYFSGNKGFTIEVELDRDLNPEQIRHIALEKIAFGLETIDNSVYDASQIIRVPGTKHPVSGLYKIPLTIKQIETLSIDEIKSIASSLDNIKDDFNWTTAAPPSEFYEIKTVKKEVKKSSYSLDLTVKPAQWKNCKWSLLQGNFKEGERHNALMVIAATCRGLGYDKETTYYMCKSALKKQATISGQEEFPKEELWENIIEQSVFTDNWEGGQYSCTKAGYLHDYCRSLGENACKLEKEDPSLIKVLEINDLINVFDDFVKNFDKNRILTGVKSLDDNLNITVGQPVAILAAPSVGKTSLLLNILANTSQQGLHSMFFSLDMYNALVTQKLLHKFTRLDFDKLKDLIISNPNQAVEYYKTVQNNMKNMHTVVRSGITVNDMRNVIQEYERTNNIKIKIVAVDYLELIASGYSEETASGGFNAKALKDLANDLQVCVLVLTQPQKLKKPDEPITSYRDLKGASLLEQSFRIIIGAYRPGFNPDHPELDQFIGLNCVKNTMGPLFSTHLKFDGLTGNVREMSEEEWEELKSLLDRKKREKEKSTGGWE